MYGLFINSYDYHVWHDLVAVSRDKDKLIEQASQDESAPLLEGGLHKSAADREERHYTIELVEEL